MTYQILLIISLLGYYVPFTSLQFTFAFQTSAFLQSLQHQLETYGPNRKSIYKQHASIIQLIQKYNELFSGQMCLEIMFSSLQPCGHGFALIKALKSNDPEAMDLLLSTVTAIMAPFAVCICGEEISKQVEKLHISAYDNVWYEEKPEIRRDLLIMMTVTGNPPTLNYRKWIYFNYIAYATVSFSTRYFLVSINN
ncbi:hypothetical protein O3M35_009788 [Rhynocoris fuscipes]|uniref:Uncharacterized protein n=1 Tax=Rhynocoris fuscipes TaxID=488301 RepID=A0AAW1D6H7_9HEMI